ncbi:MAG: hypothetical protein ACREUA_10025, partial [Burkholderiales bacterium]
HMGMKMMDENNDGKITKDEFMKGHAKKFAVMDKNSDGVIDGDERRMMMERMRDMHDKTKEDMKDMKGDKHE